MPADGRYSSLGRCKGTIRIGSFMRTTFLFVLRATFLSVLLLATRFTGHLYAIGSLGSSPPVTQCRRSLFPSKPPTRVDIRFVPEQNGRGYSSGNKCPSFSRLVLKYSSACGLGVTSHGTRSTTSSPARSSAATL